MPDLPLRPRPWRGKDHPAPRRRATSTGALLCVLALGGMLAACSSSSPASSSTDRHASTGSTSTTAASPTTTAATAATPNVAPVAWLCRPGLADDPCLSSLTASVVPAKGASRVVTASDASKPKIDCFYVYPTVSLQPTANANLHIDPQETAVAVDQASWFSQACNVYAPVYRQLTLAAISGGAGATAADAAIAYGDMLNAWQYYLANDNQGRGVAFIGHSQGAAMLIRLLRTQVDDNPTVRARLVSAILLGGNVTAPVGKTIGGSFTHIPVCTSPTQPRCIIAYSSFDQPPPADSLFGRVQSPLDSISGQTPPAAANLHVVCVNPAAKVTATTSNAQAGGSARSSGVLIPYLPTAAFPSSQVPTFSALSGGAKVATPWVTYPELYRAECMSQGGATWLQITDTTGPGDTRPVVKPTLGPTWGLHLVDVNIALGNLVDDLKRQAAAYGS
jgi:hypothetical protein